MKSPILLLLLLFISARTFAQNTFTLGSAIQYARQNSYALKSSRLDEERARAKVAETIATGLPQISGSVGYQNFIKQPVQVVPAEFFGGKAGEFEEVVFGTPQNLVLGLRAEQLVFDGSYIIGLKAAQEVVKLSSLQKEKTKKDVDKEVSDAYFMVLTAQKNANTLKSSVKTLEGLWEETQAMYENGLAEQTDADQVKVNLNNTKIAYRNAETQVELAKALLKFKMGYPVDNSISLSESLDVFTEVAPTALFESRLQYGSNIDYRLAEQNLKLQLLNLKATKAQSLPTIKASLSHNENAFRSEFNFFDRSEKFFPSTILGVNIEVPIFSSLNRTKKVKQAKIEVEKASIIEWQAKEGFKLQLANSREDLKFKYERLQNAEEAMELSDRIRNQTIIKFREGLASSFDVSQSENQFLSTQGGYIGALIEYLQARTSFEYLMNNR